MKIDNERYDSLKKELAQRFRHRDFHRLKLSEKHPALNKLRPPKKGSRYFRLFVSGAAFLAMIIVYIVFGAVGIDVHQYKSPRLCMMFSAIFFFMFLVLEIFSRMKPSTHRGMTIISLSSSMLKYISALVALCWGLSIIGVDVATIVTSMGILALIVGFGAESLIADVVTGVFMLFENEYNVGDIVEVDGFRGTVHEIGIRTTSIMDIGGNIKTINNSDMKNILNRSDNCSVAVADIGIPYETDLPAFEAKLPALMDDIYSKHSDRMKAVPVYAGVQALDASAVVLRFTVETDEQNIYTTTRIMNRELFLGFRSLGVECPYQQVDVHTK